jgi:hypothetical protein
MWRGGGLDGKGGDTAFVAWYAIGVVGRAAYVVRQQMSSARKRARCRASTAVDDKGICEG